MTELLDSSDQHAGSCEEHGGEHPAPGRTGRTGRRMQPGTRPGSRRAAAAEAAIAAARAELDQALRAAEAARAAQASADERADEAGCLRAAADTALTLVARGAEGTRLQLSGDLAETRADLAAARQAVGCPMGGCAGTTSDPRRPCDDCLAAAGEFLRAAADPVTIPEFTAALAAGDRQVARVLAARRSASPDADSGCSAGHGGTVRG